MRKTNGLERYAKEQTWQMIAVIILFAVGAFSVPHEKIAKIFGGSLSAVFLVGSIAKTACAVMPFYIIFNIGLEKIIKPQKGFCLGLLLSLPAFIVAIDNFPILPQITGDVAIRIEFSDLITYILYCLSIGLLEEGIFRGNILPLLMYKFKNTKTGLFFAIITSSAIFGSMHLLNLLGGFSANVFLQVGYSFLIGITCALTILFTKNLFAAVAVHTLFDIGGFMYEYFGSGTLWTTGNVILTIIVSVISAILLTVFFLKKDFSKVYEIWELQNKN